jgi:di/tricarboxylate transporter
MGLEAILALAVVAGVFVALLFTRWPVEAVFLAGLTVLVAAAVLPVERAFAGFANSGLITVALLYVVAGGVQETGAVEWLGRLLLGAPRGPRRALARIMLPAAGLSAFLNNTPLMALLIPLIKDWCRRTGISPSKLLLPLNYAAMLGGTCVLIGTSTNLVVSSLMVAAGQPALGMFEITPVGLPVALAGLVYLLLVSPRLLPDRVPVAADMAAAREYLTEMLVQDGGPLVGKTIAQAGLRALGGLYLLEIDRRGRVGGGPASHTRSEPCHYPDIQAGRSPQSAPAGRGRSRTTLPGGRHERARGAVSQPLRCRHHRRGAQRRAPAQQDRRHRAARGGHLAAGGTPFVSGTVSACAGFSAHQRYRWGHAAAS